MKLEIYTDGGCRGNNKTENNIGGWGAYLICNDKATSIKGYSQNTTNNIMELTSCIESLKRLRNKEVEIIIYSDSAYVVNGITSWVKGWIANGWINSKKKPVENKELWEELYSLTQRFNNLKFVKVKGHSDNAGNNQADLLCNHAMNELEKLINDGYVQH